MMALGTISGDDAARALVYLGLPSSEELPTNPLAFLAEHVANLPPTLLQPFINVTTPRQRAAIPEIKHRRMIYASTSPPPPELCADRARLRWPLLWERMGGEARPPPSANVREEEEWVENSFLPGKANSQHVKKLGGFLRGLQEEQEMEDVVMARRAERRLDDVGEEFDEESDEEEFEEPPRRDPTEPVNEEEQAEIVIAFERRILEMFVDGLDVSATDAPCA